MNDYIITAKVIELAQGYYKQSISNVPVDKIETMPDFTHYLPQATELFLECHQKVKDLIASQS